MNVSVHTGIQCGRVVGPDIAGIALGQIESKEVDLLLHAAQDNNGLAKVRLTMPRRMRQRYEHLAL